MGTVKTIWDGLNWSYLVTVATAIIPALLCITLHELSHGYVAYLLGDNTAKNAGRLTLNPLKHIDIMGLVMMVVFKVGWAKPVPVNMYNFKNPKRGMAVTALAGPISNLLIGVVFLFLYGLLYSALADGSSFQKEILDMVEVTAYLSVGLAVFNIIPIPPLDGSKVLFSALSDDTYYKLMRYEQFGMIALLALVATGVLGKPLNTAISYVFNKMFFIAQFGYDIVAR
ncbi:MAG TPA: site-2 protease family protein [Oscillospiraceae bacterium]|nr:site-2 protease family protein [Oscillospiraceae bacterium]HPS74974.1 site-2 protease family protein [Oscillospiraceae bacterium]